MSSKAVALHVSSAASWQPGSIDPCILPLRLVRAEPAARNLATHGLSCSLPVPRYCFLRSWSDLHRFSLIQPSVLAVVDETDLSRINGGISLTFKRNKASCPAASRSESAS
jgi:hypothetical protein